MASVSRLNVDPFAAAAFFVDGNDDPQGDKALEHVKVRKLRTAGPKVRKPKPASVVLVATTLAVGNSYTLARINLVDGMTYDDAMVEARALKSAHENIYNEVVDIRYFGAR
jgi:hypothetical protein